MPRPDDFNVNSPDAYPEYYFVTGDGSLDEFEDDDLDDDQ